VDLRPSSLTGEHEIRPVDPSRACRNFRPSRMIVSQFGSLSYLQSFVDGLSGIINCHSPPPQGLDHTMVLRIGCQFPSARLLNGYSMGTHMHCYVLLD